MSTNLSFELNDGILTEVTYLARDCRTSYSDDGIVQGDLQFISNGVDRSFLSSVLPDVVTVATQ